MTFGAQATLTVSSGVIARFEITPMSPLEFPVFDLVGHASADYTIALGVRAAPTLQVSCAPATPVRVTMVTCTATLSDGSSFTPTHQKSTAGGTVVVDADIPAGAAVSRYDWTGRALVATGVEISASAGCANVSGHGSFGIRSRIGLSADWSDASFVNFPTSPPGPVYLSGSPLTNGYPGILVTDSGYNVPVGTLGRTIFNYPGAPTLGRLGGAGPNKGVIFVQTIEWGPEPGAPAPGVYLNRSLQSTDPFYQRQAGPSPNCTQNDMQALSDLILRHENRHWTEARARLAPLKTQEVFERLVQLPGGPAVDDAMLAAKKAYADAVTAANNDVEFNLIPVNSNAPVCNMRK